ncbi:cyclic nucleotide-binding domain-containing protein [Vitiosangium sp. GDMCC 1.1324]|uniref:cyclic nucleotide-binding domain-containing protein n=1 Tax=Vitiosangium sp. (strain GDMCC 1.1324) TaxID=2138576 RepID=UPI000D37502F|nr:cyclic nucleotide-binding domain-containing protein [Vitiosangium sp. GDMCC 1.1324]PTL83612.1 cyclic nucleotide-binding protein [Vitiosangium sp. GDMCC 1.1324]
MSDGADTHFRQRDLAGQQAARGRLDLALAEIRQFELQGKPEEAIAGYEALARAWAHGSQLLRAIVVCKELLRVDPKHTRTQAFIANLYARYPVQPQEGEGDQVSAELELLPDREDPVAVPIFSMLTRDAFVALLEAMEVRIYGIGQPVMREGDPGSSMFFMVEGRGDVMRLLEGRGPQEGPVVEGGVFGEMALITEGPRLASVMPSVPSVLLELTRARLVELSKKHPLVDRVVHAFCRKRAADNLLRTHPIFSPLRMEQRRLVAREFQLQRVAAGTKLLTAGQMGDALYLLLRGRCTAYHVHPDGRETPYPVLREGDVFGEISLMLGKPVTAMVRADVPCVLLRLDRSAVDRHIFSQPGMRDALMQIGAERLQRTARLLADR